MALVLTHESSFSLGQLPPASSTALGLACTPIALPSRFPKSTRPTVSTSSSSGAIFVHSTSGHVLWEYDSKGRRISEVSFHGNNLSRVLPLGRTKGKERVIGGMKGKEELKVMEKAEGKWSCIDVLQGPKGKLSALTTNQDSTLIAAGSQDGELVLFDREQSSRIVVPLSDRTQGPISILVFSPSSPRVLLVSSSILSVILLVKVPSDSTLPIDVRAIRPFSSETHGRIIDIALSPVPETQINNQGGLCAVLNNNGEVALIDFADPEGTLKPISFAQSELTGLVFLDETTLAARTEKSSLLVKDLGTAYNRPKEMTCPEPILSVQRLTLSSRSARQSTAAPSSTASRRSALGENRNVANIPTPPAVPRLSMDSKGGHVDKGKASARPPATELPKTILQSRAGSLARNEGTEAEKRIVSAPTPSFVTNAKQASPHIGSGQGKRAAQPRMSSSRSVSGPIAPAIVHAGLAPAPIAGGSKHTVHIAPPPTSLASRSTTPITTIEEADEDSNPSRSRPQMESRVETQEHSPSRRSDEVGDDDRMERSVQLDWVLEPKQSRVRGSSDTDGAMTDRERIEEMWREMANLRLDMLRMKREHKVRDGFSQMIPFSSSATPKPTIVNL
ncbi:hypothetical protein I317_02440 [Kwoniella heveanensis CBS 569]|nr:hypothetical protein I317_02440 [Kwoniella heveanensis CBS 569]